MWQHCEVVLDFTFLAAVVQLVGEQVRREQLGHLVESHHPTNFQLLWSDGDTERVIIKS